MNSEFMFCSELCAFLFCNDSEYKTMDKPILFFPPFISHQ